MPTISDAARSPVHPITENFGARLSLDPRLPGHYGIVTEATACGDGVSLLLSAKAEPPQILLPVIIMVNDYAKDRAWVQHQDSTTNARVLPIPAVLDSGAAVLLHLLLDQDGSRTVVLDASALRELCSVGTLLLASALRSHSREGVRPRIINLSYAIRRELDRHPLLAFATDAGGAPLLRRSPATACGA
jgi:anti-anti-sigma regulatory factor